MSWEFGLNLEESEDEFQYVINFFDLGFESNSKNKLLEEAKNVVGKENVNHVLDGLYLIYTKNKDHINQLDELCKKYDYIFYKKPEKFS